MMKSFLKHGLPGRAGKTFRVAASLALCAVVAACGSGSADISASTGSSTGASLKSGYQQAKWSTAGNMTVTFTGDCTMTITTNDLPNHKMATYYLEPVNSTYPMMIASNFAGPLSVQPNTRTAANQT